MRHRVAGFKLGRTTAHRIAMTRNMTASLIEHERIITTIQKAKAVKHSSQHNRRQAFSKLRNKDATIKLFDVLGPRFAERPGGYCRIIKLAKRRLGDGGERAILEFVERTPKEADVPMDVDTEATAS